MMPQPISGSSFCTGTLARDLPWVDLRCYQGFVVLTTICLAFVLLIILLDSSSD